jgi:Peptidase family M48
MSGVKTIYRTAGALIFLFGAGLTAQTNRPTDPGLRVPQVIGPFPENTAVTFEELVDRSIAQERRLVDLMKNFRPIVETYLQQEKPDSELISSPKSDDYFLSRLDLTGGSPLSQQFVDPERSKKPAQKKSTKDEKRFTARDFAQAVFVDKDHFDRQSYKFEFVRWEILGDVRCTVIDVKPREERENRGFMGRIWVEDQNFNIVRFTGTYTAARSFHFDSWRLNILGVRWMPAYIYSEESNPDEPESHIPWFKAQTRIWGYDLEHAGDHREYAKPLTDTPAWVDPQRHEASQDLNPAYTLGSETYTPEDNVVERLQVAGLMAPDGDVDRILETVVNNLQITNNLDIVALRCRVLLTMPLESFVVGRTIVVSKGLLDVLPDEASLAAVLAHELAHIVLKHSLSGEYLTNLASPFSDLEIFSRFDFRFTAAQEDQADRKGQELLSNSPYKNQLGPAGLFLKALEARSRQLPNLMRGRFSNDFGSSHLVAMRTVTSSGGRLEMSRLDQVAALPLGSRITVDPWSDRIEMRKMKAVAPESAAEKMPFEVSPFFLYLKRLDAPPKAQAAARP